MGRPRTDSPTYWAEQKRIQRQRMREQGELEQIAVVVPRRDREKLLRYAAKLRRDFKREAEPARRQPDLFPDD